MAGAGTGVQDHPGQQRDQLQPLQKIFPDLGVQHGRGVIGLGSAIE